MKTIKLLLVIIFLGFVLYAAKPVILGILGDESVYLGTLIITLVVGVPITYIYAWVTRSKDDWQ